jgi:hypothetical protein
LKTKEGILENRYDFTCGPCHNWYKKRNWIIGGIFITFLIILIIGYVFAEIYFKSKCYED